MVKITLSHWMRSFGRALNANAPPEMEGALTSFMGWILP